MRSWYPPLARLFFFTQVLLNGRMRKNLSMVQLNAFAMFDRMKKRLALCENLGDLKSEASFALMFLELAEIDLYRSVYQAKYDELFDRVRFNDSLNG